LRNYALLGRDFLSFVSQQVVRIFRQRIAEEELSDAFERFQYQPRALIDLVFLYASGPVSSFPNRNEYEIIELRSWGVRAIMIARSTSRRSVRARMTGSDAPGITRILFSPNERDLPCRIAVYEW
jgi:hypothetical protein